MTSPYLHHVNLDHDINIYCIENLIMNIVLDGLVYHVVLYILKV